MNVVRTLDDRAVVMDHGSTIAEGPPREVLQNDVVIEAYLGRRAFQSEAAQEAIAALESSGEIRLDGERVDGCEPRGIIGRGLASIPESRRVFPRMSAFELIQIGGAYVRSGRESRSCLSCFLACANA